ncbi:MAG: cysteine peptidase family C39 domain-containing protein, partial [bacterium]
MTGQITYMPIGKMSEKDWMVEVANIGTGGTRTRTGQIYIVDALGMLKRECFYDIAQSRLTQDTVYETRAGIGGVFLQLVKQSSLGIQYLDKEGRLVAMAGVSNGTSTGINTSIRYRTGTRVIETIKLANGVMIDYSDTSLAMPALVTQDGYRISSGELYAYLTELSGDAWKAGDLSSSITIYADYRSDGNTNDSLSIAANPGDTIATSYVSQSVYSQISGQRLTSTWATVDATHYKQVITSGTTKVTVFYTVNGSQEVTAVQAFKATTECAALPCTGYTNLAGSFSVYDDQNNLVTTFPALRVLYRMVITISGSGDTAVKVTDFFTLTSGNVTGATAYTGEMSSKAAVSEYKTETATKYKDPGTGAVTVTNLGRSTWKALTWDPLDFSKTTRYKMFWDDLQTLANSTTTTYAVNYRRYPNDFVQYADHAITAKTEVTAGLNRAIIGSTMRYDGDGQFLYVIGADGWKNFYDKGFGSNLQLQTSLSGVVSTVQVGARNPLPATITGIVHTGVQTGLNVSTGTKTLISFAKTTAYGLFRAASSSDLLVRMITNVWRRIAIFREYVINYMDQFLIGDTTAQNTLLSGLGITGVSITAALIKNISKYRSGINRLVQSALISCGGFVLSEVLNVKAQGQFTPRSEEGIGRANLELIFQESVIDNLELSGDFVLETSFYGLRQALSSHGVAMSGVGITLAELTKAVKGSGIAIVRINGDHFVVVDEISGTSVNYTDNGIRKSMSLEEFQRRFYNGGASGDALIETAARAGVTATDLTDTAMKNVHASGTGSGGQNDSGENAAQDYNSTGGTSFWGSIADGIGSAWDST